MHACAIEKRRSNRIQNNDRRTSAINRFTWRWVSTKCRHKFCNLKLVCPYDDARKMGMKRKKTTDAKSEKLSIVRLKRLYTNRILSSRCAIALWWRGARVLAYCSVVVLFCMHAFSMSLLLIELVWVECIRCSQMGSEWCATVAPNARHFYLFILIYTS